MTNEQDTGALELPGEGTVRVPMPQPTFFNVTAQQMLAAIQGDPEHGVEAMEPAEAYAVATGAVAVALLDVADAIRDAARLHVRAAGAVVQQVTGGPRSSSGLVVM